MSVNLGNLELTLIQKIDNSTTPLEIQTYTKALEKLRSGTIYSVSTFANLPDYTTSTGKLYYVSDEQAVYYPSSVGWASLTQTYAGQIYGAGDNSSARWDCAATTIRYDPVDGILQENQLSIDNEQVSLGFRHSAVLKINGTIWGRGCTAYAALTATCTSGIMASFIPEICGDTNWCCVSAGGYNTMALKTDGSLWGWGFNSFGDIAISIPGNVSYPTQEITSSTWCEISGKYHFMGGIKTDSTLWAWGWNNTGALATNNTVCYSSPVQEITSSSNWSKISMGFYIGSGVKSDGTAWAWGQNDFGVHGTGSSINTSSPVQEISSSTDWCARYIDACRSVLLKTDGTLWGTGVVVGDGTTTNRSSPTQEFCSATNWCTADATERVAWAVKTDGTLWAWSGPNNNCGSVFGCTGTVCSPIQERTSSTNWVSVTNNFAAGNAIKRVNIG